MTTITQEQQRAIEVFLEGRHIPSGLGSKEEACSIAAINLCLYGELTDDIPGCMSEVIGHWIIRVQDSMPDKMRNGPEWRRLLPLAAGTGREHEAQRVQIILSWMWEVVLPSVQSRADACGFGAEWRAMIEQRTDAAWAAANAAARAARAAARAAAEAAWAAEAARAAAEAARAMAWADAWAAFDPPALLARLIALPAEKG